MTADFGADLRALLRAERQGMLSTISLRHRGHPFGSVVPYASWHSGEPLIYLSRLAAHTQNLLADPRAGCSSLALESLTSRLARGSASRFCVCAARRLR